MARKLQGVRELEAEAMGWELRGEVLRQWALKALALAPALAPAIPMGEWSEEYSQVVRRHRGRIEMAGGPEGCSLMGQQPQERIPTGEAPQEGKDRLPRGWAPVGPTQGGVKWQVRKPQESGLKEGRRMAQGVKPAEQISEAARLREQKQMESGLKAGAERAARRQGLRPMEKGVRWQGPKLMERAGRRQG